MASILINTPALSKSFLAILQQLLVRKASVMFGGVPPL